MGRRGPIPASGGGGGSAPTGTGFTHNTAGSQDAASTALTFTGDTTGTGTGASIALTTVKVNGASVPASGALTTGNAAYVSGASALTYSALNLAGGAGWVTGALPAANVTQATGTGYVHVTAGALDAASTGITFTGDTTGTGTGASIALATVAVTGAAGTLPLASTAANIQWASTTTTPTLNMATHATTPQAMTVQAANVTTGTGSALNLTSGTGSVAAGNVVIQTGGTALCTFAPLVATIAAGSRLAFGTTPATVGPICLPNNVGTIMSIRNNTNTADWPFIITSGVALVAFGNNNTDVQVNGNSIALASSASTLNLTSATAIPIVGNLQLGLLTTAMADADKTVTATNCRNNVHIFTGANTGVRAVTFNVAPTSGTIKFIRNNCTTFGITVQFSSGAATGTILPGTSAVIIADGTNAVVLLSGT